MANINIKNLGTMGVNVDKNPLELDDAELTKAQNATVETVGGRSSVKKRPGLIEFNSITLAGSVLGGIGIPHFNKKSGIRFFYIGRGTL